MPAVRRPDDRRPRSERGLHRGACDEPVPRGGDDLRLQRREGEDGHAGVLQDRVAEDVLDVVVDHRRQPAQDDARQREGDDQQPLPATGGRRTGDDLAPVEGDEDEDRAAPRERCGDRERADALHEPRGPDVEWNQAASNRDRRDHPQEPEPQTELATGSRLDGAGAERACRRCAPGDDDHAEQPGAEDRERATTRRPDARRSIRPVQPAAQAGDDDAGDAAGRQGRHRARGIAGRERDGRDGQSDERRPDDRQPAAHRDLEQGQDRQAGRPGNRHRPDEGRAHEPDATDPKGLLGWHHEGERHHTEGADEPDDERHGGPAAGRDDRHDPRRERDRREHEEGHRRMPVRCAAGGRRTRGSPRPRRLVPPRRPARSPRPSRR